ncbi:hypothetical protein Mapa_017644 [Marchantia paleacea]|nr:hypothetical protein Mapa_017644 [Marchantia paleacea]
MWQRYSGASRILAAQVISSGYAKEAEHTGNNKQGQVAPWRRKGSKQLVTMKKQSLCGKP